MYSTNSRVTYVTEKMKQFSELFKLFKIQDRSQAAVNDLASLQPFPNGLLLHSVQSFPGVFWFDSDACSYFSLCGRTRREFEWPEMHIYFSLTSRIWASNSG